MKTYLSLLSNINLFKQIKESDILSMLSCLDANIKQYKKGEFVFIAGDAVENIGIVLEGSAHIIKENLEGDRVIMATLEEGDYFAEALCCAGVRESPVSVQTTSKSKIMLLNFSRILHTCPNSCTFHAQLIENMLYVLANKNLLMQNRMEIITQKTLRLKVLHYLQSFTSSSQHSGGNIIIPFSREELADFLCVDRTSLSHELSRMKQDGLIDYHKNCFRLL